MSFSLSTGYQKSKKAVAFSKSIGFLFPTTRTSLARSIIIPSDAVFCNRFRRFAEHIEKRRVGIRCRTRRLFFQFLFCGKQLPIFLPAMLSDWHNGMDIVIKEQNQSGTYSIIIVRKVISRKLPFLYQLPCDGVIAEISHVISSGLCRCPFEKAHQANSRRYRSVSRDKGNPSFFHPDSTQAHNRDAGI